MESELRRLVDALPGLVWTTLPDGTGNVINPRWREFSGLTGDEIRTHGWETAIHPDDLAGARARWDRLIAAGAPGEMEVRLRRHDGEYRRFNINACPLKDASGQLIGWCGINTEIEDRRRTEDALTAQERRFQVIIDSLPAIVALFRPNGLMSYSNKRMLAYHGQTLQQMQQGEPGYTFHPDDRPGVLDLWRSSVETGEPFDCKVRLLRGDGVYRWHWVQGFPLINAEGRIDLWYGLFTDIDDVTRAEALLAGEKRLLEEVARGRPLPHTLDDLSRLVEELVPGCSCSILLVEPGGERFKVGSGPSLPGHYNAILDGKTIDAGYGPCSLAVALKAPVITADLANDPRWKGSAWPPLMAEIGLASCWSMPILTGDQEVLGIFALYRREPEAPTTFEQELIDRFTKIASIAIERAQGDEALRASEAELRQAYVQITEAQRLSQTGSFTSDVAADEHRWSDEIYAIFEFPRGQAISMRMVQAVLHPDDRAQFDSGFARALGGGADFDGEFRIVTPSGRLKHLRCVAHRMTQAEGRFVFTGAIQDVTARKLAEEALNRARAELTHMARATALSTLTASIAHEVNQPLAGIITNASTCLRMLAADPPNIDGARATAQRTIRDGNRASDVIQRLRALFARRPPAMEPVDLNETALEVLALSASELQRRRVFLRTDLAENLRAVTADRVQLQQVILNLVLNAADAMNAVEDRPRDLLVTTALNPTGDVCLSVRDAGEGIDPQILERLFDAFYTTKADGMGVGLSISRSIIQGHDGRIWASANDGPGATFAFTIPGGTDRPADPTGSGAAGASQALRQA
jgi:PAS domain S-box-containing protein